MEIWGVFKKVTWGWQKMGQKYQNLRQLQTAISQARNKLLTYFQRLESTARHGNAKLQYLKLETSFWQTFKGLNRHWHIVCIQKSDIGMMKKLGKGTFKLQYLKLETSFWQTFKGWNQLFYMITIFYTFLCNTKFMVTK